MAGDTFHDNHACPSCAALTAKLADAEKDRDVWRLAQELSTMTDIHAQAAATWQERAERAEAERDEARTALRAILGVALDPDGNSLGIYNAGLGRALRAARALVEGWGDAKT